MPREGIEQPCSAPSVAGLGSLGKAKTQAVPVTTHLFPGLLRVFF